MGTKYLVDADTGDIWSVRNIHADGDVIADGKVSATGNVEAGANVVGVDAVLSGNVSAANAILSGSIGADSATFVGAVAAATGVFTGSVSAASGTFTGGSVFDSITINDPVTNAHDAATKEYVLSATLGFDWQLPIISFFDNTVALPVGPGDGDRYVALVTANGWTINNIYEWDTGGGVWVETVVIDRMSSLNYDDSTFYTYVGAPTSAWTVVFMPGAHNDLLNKQGGAPLEYYHLTAAEHATVNGGLALYDTDASDKLRMVWNEASAAGRTLNFLVNGGDRSISLSGDLAVSAACGTLNQSVANGASPTFGTITATSISCGQMVPVGSIIPFYDFDGVFTFNAANWKYCNGATHDFGGMIGVKTLPDLSNRYLVGYGTDGGGDIGSAAWDASVAGNANHQINIAHLHSVSPPVTTSSLESSPHYHTVPGHYHSLGSASASSSSSSGIQSLDHTHSFTTGTASANHSHSVSIYYKANGGTGAGNGENLFTSGSVETGGYTDSTGAAHSHSGSTSGMSGNHTHSISTSTSLSGNVGGTGTGIYGDSVMQSGAPTATHSHSVTIGAFNSASSGSTTQSIQPRSIRVRYIMRVL